jgi:hypothetical protein
MRNKKIIFKNKIKDIIGTRIRRNNYSVYVNAPSREIKRWFEARIIYDLD